MNSRTGRVAAALLALVIGVWVGLRLHPHAAPPIVGVRVPAGESSPPTPSDLDKPWDPDVPPRIVIPDRLPEFSLADRAGKRTSIAAWQGKSLIINFWATWCAPCRREIPLLESLSQDWGGRNVQVVGVAVGEAVGSWPWLIGIESDRTLGIRVDRADYLKAGLARLGTGRVNRYLRGRALAHVRDGAGPI